MAIDKRAVLPFNIRTVKASILGTQQFVQDEKIKIARTTITKFQYAGSWPDEYYSYLTSELRGNQFKEPKRFYDLMHKRPQYYAKRFIFRPQGTNGARIAEAARYAFGLMLSHVRYFKNPTGFYAQSFRILIDGKYAAVDSLQTTSREQLTGDSVVRIYNVAPYASALESHFLNVLNIGGLMYYAAQMTRRKFGDVGVRFDFRQSQNLPGTISKYMLPVLSLGSRDNVVDKMTKPGKNFRRRQRQARAAARNS